MKALILIPTLVLLCNFCNAKKPSTLKKDAHKLTYEEFMGYYGLDDTSIAIIDIFFDKRENSATGQMSFLPLSAAVTVAVPPLGAGLMVISSPLFVSGLITSRKYSRKKLLKTLLAYQNNNLLSKRHRKKVTNLMDAQEYMYIEDLLEARYRSLE